MKRLAFCILPLLIATACHGPSSARTSQQPSRTRLETMADSALTYCRSKGMNTEWCLLVDMKEPPGRYRFHVWDFDKGEATLSSLCCHGMGGGSTGAQPVFSNASGSYCTSLGRYRVGVRALSQYGIKVHYKLHGLDSTNNNAFKRIIVLHSHTPVPETEIYPAVLPMGWSLGCPVISDGAMKKVDAMLKEASAPVLLWIFY